MLSGITNFPESHGSQEEHKSGVFWRYYKTTYFSNYEIANQLLQLLLLFGKPLHDNGDLLDLKWIISNISYYIDPFKIKIHAKLLKN